MIQNSNISKLLGFFTKFLVLASFIMLSTAAHSNYRQLQTKAQQIKALDDIVDLYRFQSSGLDWKAELYGFDPDEIRDRYRSYIMDAKTLDEAKGIAPQQEREILTPDEFRYLMVGITSEFHDGHSYLMKFIGKASTAGLRTVALNGRLLVSALHDSLHKPVSEEFQVQKYDEVIEIDGLPVSFYKNRNLNYVSNGTIQARKDEALERILEIPHSFIPPFSNLPTVKIKFRRGEQEFTNEYEWTTVDEIDLTRPVSPSNIARNEEMYLRDSEFVFGAKGAVRSTFMEGLRNLVAEQDPNDPSIMVQDIGHQLNYSMSNEFLNVAKSIADSAFNQQLPAPLDPEQVGQVMQQMAMLTPVERIKAYIIQEKDKKPVAMIRIPSYAPNSFGEVLREINFISMVIANLNNTDIDTIIIDQGTNPGGYVAYVNLLLRLFASPEKPLVAQKIQYVLSEILFSSYLQTGGLDQMLTGEAIDADQRREYLEFIREQMNSGMAMTSWLPFNLDLDLRTEDTYGTIEVTENAPYWDKNLIVLSDSRSASGAEFFPAIIQDNKRGLIIGETSMGLGNPVVGHIDTVQRAEMRVRCAFAMCRRYNEEFPHIENLGVHPDVLRSIHIKDLKDGLKKNALDILRAAELHREGKSPRDIQIDLNRTNSLQQARLFTAEDARLLNQGLTRVVQQFRQEVSGLDQPIEENVEPWIIAYQKLFDTLAELEDARDVPHEAWDLVAIPLPDELIQNDYVLKKETRKDIVLRRLEEILESGALKNKPNTQRLVQHLFDNAYRIQGFFHFNEPCELIFQ